MDKKGLRAKVLRFRAQAATEYLMTYGWAFLIIAVVAAILIALGVFHPAPTSSLTGFTPLQPKSASCLVAATNNLPKGLYLTFYNALPYPINVSQVTFSNPSGITSPTGLRYFPITSSLSSVPTTNQTIPSASNFVIYINTTCPSPAGTAYSSGITITYTNVNTGLPGSASGTVSGTTAQ